MRNKVILSDKEMKNFLENNFEKYYFSKTEQRTKGGLLCRENIVDQYCFCHSNIIDCDCEDLETRGLNTVLLAVVNN